MPTGLMGYTPPTDTTTTGLTNWLTGQYQGLLGRAPDQPGLQNWLTAMKGGTRPEQIYGNFLNSPEFQQRQAPAPDQQWLTSAYQGLMGRAPDAEGLNYWTQQAGSKAPGQLWNDFLASPEEDAYAAAHPWSAANDQGGGQGDWTPPRGTIGRLGDPSRFLRPSPTQPGYLTTNAWHDAANLPPPQQWNNAVNWNSYFPRLPGNSSPGSPNTNTVGTNFTRNLNGTPTTFTHGNRAGDMPHDPVYQAPSNPIRFLRETPSTGTVGNGIPGSPVVTGNTGNTGNTGGANPSITPALNTQDDRVLPYQPATGQTPDPNVNAYMNNGAGENTPSWYNASGLSAAMNDLVRQGLIQDPFAPYKDPADGLWKYPKYSDAEWKQLAGNLWQLPAFQQRWGTDQRIRSLSPQLMQQLGLTPFWQTAAGFKQGNDMAEGFKQGNDMFQQSMTGKQTSGETPPFIPPEAQIEQQQIPPQVQQPQQGASMFNPFTATPQPAQQPAQPQQLPGANWAPSQPNGAQLAQMQQELAGMDQWEQQYKGWVQEGGSPQEIARRQSYYDDMVKKNAIDRQWMQEKMNGTDWGSSTSAAIARAIQQNPQALQFFQQTYGGFNPAIYNDVNNNMLRVQALTAAMGGDPSQAQQMPDWAMNDLTTRFLYGKGV